MRVRMQAVSRDADLHSDGARSWCSDRGLTQKSKCLKKCSAQLQTGAQQFPIARSRLRLMRGSLERPCCRFLVRSKLELEPGFVIEILEWDKGDLDQLPFPLLFFKEPGMSKRMSSWQQREWPLIRTRRCIAAAMSFVPATLPVIRSLPALELWLKSRTRPDDDQGCFAGRDFSYDISLSLLRSIDRFPLLRGKERPFNNLTNKLPAGGRWNSAT